MKEVPEYTPSKAEIVEAERLLDPEQVAGSKARYEIMKHKEIFQKVGLAEEQIQQVTVYASEKAIEEYRQFERQGPWRQIMNALEE